MKAPDMPSQAPDHQAPGAPWWRFGIVWMVIGGPLSVVVASLVTAVVAWKHIDPVITPERPGVAAERAGDDVAATSDPKDTLAPALKARNHAATPSR